MATSVKRLVTLANELHSAYTALTVFDNNPSCDNMSVREWRYQLDVLKRQEEKATERLALAIEQASSERVAQAEISVGKDVV